MLSLSSGAATGGRLTQRRMGWGYHPSGLLK